MAIGIAIEVHGDTQLKRKIVRLTDNVRDPAPAWTRIINYLRRVEQTQFATEGGSGSGGWVPLKPATIAAKRRHGESPRIMRASDRLRLAFIGQTSDSLIRRSRNSMFYGVGLDYARFHQHGTRRMPMRKVVELTRRNRQMVVKILQDWLMRGVR